LKKKELKKLIRTFNMMKEFILILDVDDKFSEEKFIQSVLKNVPNNITIKMQKIEEYNG
jgi:hypothetical protein